MHMFLLAYNMSHEQAAKLRSNLKKWKGTKAYDLYKEFLSGKFVDMQHSFDMPSLNFVNNFWLPFCVEDHKAWEPTCTVQDKATSFTNLAAKVTATVRKTGGPKNAPE